MVEFSFDAKSLEIADRNIDREISVFEQKEKPTFKIVKNVLLRWHQMNTEEAKIEGLRSGDKAIIDEISDRPLSVFSRQARRS